MFTALLATSACTALQAQTGNGAGSSRSGSANVMADTAFIGKSMRDNMMEIQLSQLAVERASAPAVKSAAQQLVTDHTQMLNDLTRIGRKNNMPAMAGSNMSGSGAGSTGAGTSGSGATASGATGSGTTGSTGNMGAGTAGSGATGMGTTGSGSSGSGSRSGSMGTGTSGSGTTGSGTTGTGATGMGTTGSGSGTTGSSTTGSGGIGSNSGAGTTGSGAIMGNTASGASGSTGAGMGAHDNMGMGGMTALRNATGAEFDRLWVTQMLSMHEAKLAELTASANTLSDPELRAAVTQAIPKIRMHRDLLSKLSTTNTGR